MCKKTSFIIVLICCATLNMFAQKDTIIQLKEVVIPSYKLKKYSKGYSFKSLKDSLVERNPSSLTDVLRFNSFIYFKENGNGMVSSPSFRGTTASQTIVLWNGININSQLNGQIDFNTIGINSLDEISIRSGGGSVLFGSGAIGGSIHLDNNIEFIKKTKHALSISYGSFSTQNLHYKTKISNTKFYFDFSLGANKSDNDFRFLNTNIFNENGEYYNGSFDVNLGYKIDAKNSLKWYSNTFISDRNLSRTLTAPSLSKYKDKTYRNLLVWNSFLNPKEIITTKIAYIFQEFKYFENRLNSNIFSTGKTNSKILNLDYKKVFSKNIQFAASLGLEQNNGNGDNLENKTRTIYSYVLVYDHKLSNSFSYNIQFRKEFLKAYRAPFVYSFGLEYQINKFYSISINGSKNFRTPTFNDLYWIGSGNPDLKPETSHQVELGNKIKFNSFLAQINAFYISSKDLIQWKPNDFGIWTPINVAKAMNYGSEVTLDYTLLLNKNQALNISSNYSYTIAEDKIKTEQLIYVPKHRIVSTISYTKNNFLIFYQHLFNGSVKVPADYLPSYEVGNLGIDYLFKRVKLSPKIGLKINNIFNNNYQNTQNRPMPSRNIQIKLKLNF